MESVAMYVAYSGRWNRENSYVDHKTHIILLPKDSTLQDLELKICKALKVNSVETNLIIWFDTKIAGEKGMRLSSDDDVETCLHLVKMNSDFKNSYLIVETSLENRNERQVAGESLTQPNTSPGIGSMIPRGTKSLSKGVDSNEENESYRVQTRILDGDASEGEIKKNAVFESKAKLYECMDKLNIRNHKEYLVARSCKQRLGLRCKSSGCDWSIDARRVRQTTLFKITRFNRVHKCSIGAGQTGQRHATARWISQNILEKVHDRNGKIKPSEIIDDLRREKGVKISYLKAYRALHHAIDSIRGTPEKNYRMLPSYIHMMKARNPGTYAEFDFTEDDRFQHLFFAYGASIEGWKFCRPVIVVDATFLSCRYRGVLMIAVSKDGNNNTFPIAFGVAESESNQSWLWFFEHLKKAIGDREQLTILSDRNQSIRTAVSTLYPTCFHGVCTYHLQQNLITKFHKPGAIGLYQSASAAYRREDFNDYMEQIKRMDQDMYKYLMDVQPSRWARSHAPYRRYNMLTTNIVESMNAVLKEARQLPILCLADKIESLQQDWYKERKLNAMGTFHNISKWAVEELDLKMDAAFRMKVDALDEYVFKVRDRRKKLFLVNLKEKTCTCLQYDLDEIPCCHAIAAIRERNMDVTKFCSEWCSKTNLLKTYSGKIMPVGDEETWVIPNTVKKNLKPPKKEIPRGARKKARYPSTGEHIKQTRRCTRCRRRGHNKTSCTFTSVRHGA